MNMKYCSYLKASAFALTLPLLFASHAAGATMWVDGVLSPPSSHINADTTAVTDQSYATSWTINTLEAGESLTLTWSNPVYNDGTGTITVSGAANTIPGPAQLSFNVRLLLSDGSYTAIQTIVPTTGVKSANLEIKKLVSTQILRISDHYSGPLGIKGIEFTNLMPYMVGETVEHGDFNVMAVYATVPAPIPEPGVSLLSLAGVGLVLFRRRRA